MGGLIIRGALPYLEDYKDKMYTLATLMTPHIGIASIGQSTLMRTGISIYSRICPHFAVKEMSLRDAPNIEDCYLAKLSQAPGLEWFKHVLLFSTYQDNYIPYDSARIEMGAWSNNSGYKTQRKMVENILVKLETCNVVRIDLNLKTLKGSEKITGRKAHMIIIEDFLVQTLFVYFYCRYFC